VWITIAAVATPPGYGGVGIIRVSGKKAKQAVIEVNAGNVRTLSLVSIQEALVDQVFDGFFDGALTDVEPFRQLGLGRDQVARDQGAAFDAVAQVILDGPVKWRDGHGFAVVGASGG